VTKQLDSVQVLNLRLAGLLGSAIEVAEQQAVSLTKVRGLEDALQNVQSLGLRLTGLIELGLDLAKARDPQELIDLFCRALQDILSSRYAGVVVIGGKGGPPLRFMRAVSIRKPVRVWRVRLPIAMLRRGSSGTAATAGW
jgi:hypothetical protein